MINFKLSFQKFAAWIILILAILNMANTIGGCKPNHYHYTNIAVKHKKEKILNARQIAKTTGIRAIKKRKR